MKTKKSFDDAVVKAQQYSMLAAQVTIEPDTAIVWHEKRGEWVYYRAKAWEQPSGNMLPWSAPEYLAFAVVDVQGLITPGPAFESLV